MPIRPSNVAPTPSPPPTEVRPSSSHLDACGLSPIPTSTPSLSPTIANMPTDEDVPNLAMEAPPPPFPFNDRPMITLINGVLHPSKVAAKAVTLSIKPSTSGAIPKDHQELFFQRFKEEFEARLSQARSNAASSVG
ncbi:hypothetical protein HKD37_12G034496 [Glycine soja]